MYRSIHMLAVTGLSVVDARRDEKSSIGCMCARMNAEWYLGRCLLDRLLG